MRRTRTRSTRISGFSLVELAAVITVGASVVAVLGPGFGQVRSQMRGVSSEGNLSTIGQVGAMYALDNDDRIFSYTWRGGEQYINIRNGKTLSPSSDLTAAGFQMRDILFRATGRFEGQGRITPSWERIPHRRYSHLILADYMGGNVSDPLWADPADGNLLHWQLNPLEYLQEENSFPYGTAIDDNHHIYDNDDGWYTAAVRQKWAFASSYQAVPHAWQLDFGSQYVPQTSTPHLFVRIGNFNTPLGERRFNEVRFPSAKVHMFEEFDREQAGSPYFAYDHAQPAKLMFDGSINTAMSGLAHSSVSPQDYTNGRRTHWVQHYIPLHTFPLPLQVQPDDKVFPVNMRYRWTLGGLQGIDYPQTLMPARGR